MKKLYILSGLLFLGALTQVKAQLSYGNEQFFFNPIPVNSSMAGYHNGQIQLGYDARWLGLDGAPQTGFIRFDKMFNGNTGWDVSVISDRVGPVSSIALANAFAYHMKATESFNISFGIRHHLTQNYFNANSATLSDPADPLLMSDQVGVPINNFDASISVDNPNKFMVGFTYRNMIPQRAFRNTTTVVPNIIQYAVLGVNGWYRHDFDNLGLEAFANAATSANQPTTIQVGALAVIQNRFGVGANFSPGNQAGIMAYVVATSKLNVFYNYNMPISDIAQVSKQSHGLGIGFRVGKETLIGNSLFLQPTNESHRNRMF